MMCFVARVRRLSGLAFLGKFVVFERSELQIFREKNAN